MAFFKVGLSSTVFLFAIIITIKADYDDTGTSQNNYKPWREYPIRQRIEEGRIPESNMPYRYQEYEGKTNMPFDKYENNNKYDNSESEETWNGPILTEHTLRRDPYTGKLYITEVKKYRRDYYAQNGWKELGNGKRSHNLHEPDNTRQLNTEATNGMYKHVKKQLNNDIYKYNSRYYQPEDVEVSSVPTQSEDNNESVLLNKLFRRPVSDSPTDVTPIIGITSANGIENENSKQKSEDRSQQPFDTSIYHRRATICVVNGDPEKCRGMMQMAMYLKMILDSRRGFENSDIPEKIQSMKKNLNDMWEKGGNLENWYLKMLSQIMGKQIGIAENNSTKDSFEQSIVGEVLNLWNKIFGDESDHTKNHNEDSSQGINTEEEVADIWKEILKNAFNINTAKEESLGKKNVTEDIDTFLSNLPSSLFTTLRYVINDMFSNKTTEDNETSNNNRLLQEIVNLWKILISILNISNNLYPHFDHILLQIKTTSEYFLTTLLKQLDLSDADIDSFKKIWDSLWDSIFSYLSQLQNATGNVKSDKGKEGSNAGNWEKFIQDILFKNIYGSREESDINKNPENVNITSIQEITTATNQNMDYDYGSIETRENDTETELDYSWEDLLHKMAIKFGEVNGTLVYPGDDVPDTTVAPELNVKDTSAIAEEDILKMVSRKFERDENEEYGSTEDNFWEEMMHEIVNTENEMHHNNSEVEENDIWGNLKKHFNITDDKDNKNYIGQYFMNAILGSDSTMDSDMYSGHMSAIEYIKKWVNDYVNPIEGQDDIWKILFNDTEIAETEVTTNEDYISTDAVTTPVSETSTRNEILNGTSTEPIPDNTFVHELNTSEEAV